MLSCVCTHTHIQRLFPREKNELDTRKKRGPRAGSAQSVSSPPSVPAHHSDAIRVLQNASCIHHCLVNVSPFPSASSRALYEGTKNKEFRNTKPNLFSSHLERVGSVILVQHESPSRAFPPPARATVISAHEGYLIVDIIAFKCARAKRAKCVLFRSDRKERKKKLTFFHKRKPF